MDLSSDGCSSDLVFDQRRLDLVGAADQHFGALDALVHVDHFSRGQLRFGGLARDGRGCGSLVLVVGADDGVSGDFLFDLDGHDAVPGVRVCGAWCGRSEEHTSELQSLMRISYAVFCLKKKTTRLHTFI